MASFLYMGGTVGNVNCGLVIIAYAQSVNQIDFKGFDH
jgi:hypothetical protein